MNSKTVLSRRVPVQRWDVQWSNPREPAAKVVVLLGDREPRAVELILSADEWEKLEPFARGGHEWLKLTISVDGDALKARIDQLERELASVRSLLEAR